MKKIRIVFMLGMFVGVFISIVGVFASNYIMANEISYTRSSSSVTNVEDALDEIYNKLETGNILAEDELIAEYTDNDGTLVSISGIFEFKLKKIKDVKYVSVFWKTSASSVAIPIVNRNNWTGYCTTKWASDNHVYAIPRNDLYECPGIVDNEDGSVSVKVKQPGSVSSYTGYRRVEMVVLGYSTKQET